MKKYSVFIAMGLMAFLLTACGSKLDYPAALEQEDYSIVTERLEELAVDSHSEAVRTAASGGYDIPEGEKAPDPVYSTMTIPANYVGERAQDELDNLTTYAGYKSVTLNEDGTVSYVMTENQKKAWMEEVKQYISMTIKSYQDEFQLSPYVPYEANSNYSVIRVITNNPDQDFSIDSGYPVYDVIQLGKMYNIYNQTELDNIDVIMSYMDDAIYEAYLKEYAQYQDDLKAYEQADAQYQNDVKNYSNAQEDYKKAYAQYEKDVKKWEQDKDYYTKNPSGKWESGWDGYSVRNSKNEYVTRAWIYSGYWYYIDDNGVMVINDVINDEGTYYFLGSDGRVTSGDNDKFITYGDDEDVDTKTITKIVPVKPEKPVEPKKPVPPVKPTEPTAPRPIDICTVSSSTLFAEGRAN